MTDKCAPIKIGASEISHYNEHNPHDYVKKLQGMDADKLYNECKDMIWFSEYASCNCSSDFHWMRIACYEECKARGITEVYNAAIRQFLGVK